MRQLRTEETRQKRFVLHAAVLLLPKLKRSAARRLPFRLSFAASSAAKLKHGAQREPRRSHEPLQHGEATRLHRLGLGGVTSEYLSRMWL
jgi:hypothetical protein